MLNGTEQELVLTQSDKNSVIKKVRVKNYPTMI